MFQPDESDFTVQMALFWERALIIFFFAQVIFFFLQCTWPQLADSTVIIARARSEDDFSLCFCADPCHHRTKAEAPVNYSHLWVFKITWIIRSLWEKSRSRCGVLLSLSSALILLSLFIRLAKMARRETDGRQLCDDTASRSRRSDWEQMQQLWDKFMFGQGMLWGSWLSAGGRTNWMEPEPFKTFEKIIRVIQNYRVREEAVMMERGSEMAEWRGWERTRGSWCGSTCQETFKMSARWPEKRSGWTDVNFITATPSKTRGWKESLLHRCRAASHQARLKSKRSTHVVTKPMRSSAPSWKQLCCAVLTAQVS